MTLSQELINELIRNEYELTTLTYYDSGYKEITGYVRFIRNHMGGNYGATEEYELINEEGKFNFLYYGDRSARIKKIL